MTPPTWVNQRTMPESWKTVRVGQLFSSWPFRNREDTALSALDREWAHSSLCQTSPNKTPVGSFLKWVQARSLPGNMNSPYLPGPVSEKSHWQQGFNLPSKSPFPDKQALKNPPCVWPFERPSHQIDEEEAEEFTAVFARKRSSLQKGCVAPERLTRKAGNP